MQKGGVSVSPAESAALVTPMQRARLSPCFRLLYKVVQLSSLCVAHASLRGGQRLNSHATLLGLTFEPSAEGTRQALLPDTYSAHEHQRLELSMGSGMGSSPCCHPRRRSLLSWMMRSCLSHPSQAAWVGARPHVLPAHCGHPLSACQ